MLTFASRYKPDVSLRFLTSELAFTGAEEADRNDPDAGHKQCLEFITKHGGETLIERKDDDIRVLTGKGAAIFQAAKTGAFRGVDIKGQI